MHEHHFSHHALPHCRLLEMWTMTPIRDISFPKYHEPVIRLGVLKHLLCISSHFPASTLPTIPAAYSPLLPAHTWCAGRCRPWPQASAAPPSSNASTSTPPNAPIHTYPSIHLLTQVTPIGLPRIFEFLKKSHSSRNTYGRLIHIKSDLDIT